MLKFFDSYRTKWNRKKGRKESTQKERTNHQYSRYSCPSTNSVYVHESV